MIFKKLKKLTEKSLFKILKSPKNHAFSAYSYNEKSIKNNKKITNHMMKFHVATNLASYMPYRNQFYRTIIKKQSYFQITIQKIMNIFFNLRKIGINSYRALCD